MTGAAKAAVLGVLGFVVFQVTRGNGNQTGADDLGGLSLTFFPRRIQDFARAIARAEGFYVPGSIPMRAHNPGNLKTPTWTAPGELEGNTLGEGIAVFESEDAGWNALYRQLNLIVQGRSNVYNLDMSINEMAARYTGTPAEARAWANNVSLAMGASASAPLRSLLV